MKPDAKKTMRVATVFTGAAACAAAFAPSAMATTKPAAVERLDHKLMLAGKNTLRGALGAPRNSGSIRSTNKCSTVPHWLHILWVNGSGLVIETCVGFHGTISGPHAIKVFAQCGGTNIGYLASGTRHITYGPGNTYRTFTPSLNVTKIHISRWTGNDAC
jgi:hypothetical protein